MKRRLDGHTSFCAQGLKQIVTDYMEVHAA